MKIFGENRNCFVVYNVSTVDSKGAVLTFPEIDGTSATIPDGGDLGLVIQDVSMEEKEAVGHLRCFANAIYTYAFGADLGMVSVTFLAFLNAGKAMGAKGASDVNKNGDSFDKVVKLYKNSRISASRKNAYVTIGKAVLNGQVIGLSGGTQSVNENIQRFTLSMAMPKIQG